MTKLIEEWGRILVSLVSERMKIPTSPPKDVAANFIKNYLFEPTEQVNLEAVANTIVRAHRARAKPSREQRGPRRLFIKFSRDDVAGTYLTCSVKLKVSQLGVRVKRQFSKSVQARVDQALIVRRDLLKKKEIIQGYVDYPAVLRVMKTGTKNFVVHEEF